MKKLLLTGATACVLALGVPPAQAQLAAESALAKASGWTFGFGVDYAEGEYNTGSDDNWTWTFPFTAKYETGPWTLRASIAYVRAHGVNRDVGAAQPGAVAAVTVAPGTQSGLGDTFLSVFYTVADPAKYAVGVDLGARVKIVTASKDNDLITTGNTDYSLQADLYQAFGPYTVFGVIGWTSKGDIRFRDRDLILPGGARNPTFGLFLEQGTKDPWYFAIGGNYKLSPQTTLGASYDFREKITDTGDEISEASVFLTHRITRQWRVQPYALVGFSDASPDWGLGAVFNYEF
jgi:predicted porin